MTSTSWPDGDRLADVADLAGLLGRPVHAVEALGEDPGHRGLADAPGAAEEVGVGDPVHPDRVAQGLDDVVLADDVLEPLRPVAPGDDRVRLAARRAAIHRPRPLRPGLRGRWHRYFDPRREGTRARSIEPADEAYHPARDTTGSTRPARLRPRDRSPGPGLEGRPGRRRTGRGQGEPGRFSRAHEGDVYGCCVPALTRFTSPHCPGPPRLTQTPAHMADAGSIPIVRLRPDRVQGQDRKID